MANYSELTADEQARLAQHQTLLRPAIGAGARYVRQAADVLLDADSDGEISRLCGSYSLVEGEKTYTAGVLAGDEVVPNSTGLAGATGLTADEVADLIYGLRRVTSDYGGDEVKQLHARAAGVPNITGV